MGCTYPILHSKNLVDWETVGYVFFPRGQQANAHFWAQRYPRQRQIYIYYTAQRRGGNLLPMRLAKHNKPTRLYRPRPFPVLSGTHRCLSHSRRKARLWSGKKMGNSKPAHAHFGATPDEADHALLGRKI